MTGNQEPKLTVALPVHKTALMPYVHKWERYCKKYGYKLDVYDQRQNNKSALVGRKRLVERCTTEYIWLVDADDKALGPIPFELEYDMEIINCPTFCHWDLEEEVTYNYRPPTWLRIVKTEVAKKAISHYPDFFAIDAEDSLCSYWLDIEAKTKRFHKEVELYEYNAATSSVAIWYKEEAYKYKKIYEYLPDEMQGAFERNKEHRDKLKPPTVIGRDSEGYSKLLKMKREETNELKRNQKET